MANFPRSIAIILVFGCFSMAGGCSTRQVYTTPVTEAPPLSAVNINTATIDELERLPHIGRKTAEAIVSFREQNGPFERPESLMLIRGMSEKRFAEIRSYIRTE